MRKIGIILANTPVYSETFLVSLINGLADKGNEIMLFTHQRSKDLSYLHNTVRVVEPYAVSSNKLLQTIKTVFVLTKVFVCSPVHARSFLRLEKNDGFSLGERLKRLYLNAHILSYSLDWLYFGFATMGLTHENTAKAVGGKSATSFRGFDICNYPIKHPGCYDLLFKKIDKVHSISDDLYNEAKLQGLSPTINYAKITPAINTEKFCKHRPQKTLNGKVNIISTGRLTWQKGYEYALEALSELPIDFDFTIVGEGEDRERLAYAAYQWGIAHKVHLIGKRPHSEIAHLLANADIYIQPSVQEGFCNAVLEAQAGGLLCVVSNAGGLSENVENGKSGLVVPKRNPKAIVDAIMQIINMPIDSRQAMSDYAVERVIKDFNVKEQINKFIQFFD